MRTRIRPEAVRKRATRCVSLVKSCLKALGGGWGKAHMLAKVLGEFWGRHLKRSLPPTQSVALSATQRDATRRRVPKNMAKADKQGRNRTYAIGNDRTSDKHTRDSKKHHADARNTKAESNGHSGARATLMHTTMHKCTHNRPAEPKSCRATRGGRSEHTRNTLNSTQARQSTCTSPSPLP